MASDPGGPDGGGARIGSIEEAFSTLSDETRMRILLELIEVASEDGIGHGLTFSALRKQVGVTDSGRFNYHLSQLEGQFVAKVGEEYVARWPGLMLGSAMYAGVYDDADVADLEDAETEAVCPRCHDTLEVRYTEETLGTGVYLHCDDHGKMDEYWFPPGAKTGRTLLELMTVAYRRLLTNARLGREGICLECWGRVSVEYPAEKPQGPGEDAEGTSNPDDYVTVGLSCERCWNRLWFPLRTFIATHPVVQAAFDRRGYELLEMTDALTSERGVDCTTEVVATDPSRATIRIGFEDETLDLTVSEDCSVLEVDREATDDPRE